MSAVSEVARLTGADQLPGAIGLTRVQVYDSQGPDGLRGGTPHLHLVCAECYVVVAGRGTVQTLSAAGYREDELVPERVVWFSPGVIHRLVNLDGQLQILVLMQNAGLPEAGDLFMTFPEAVTGDPAAYRDAALDPTTSTSAAVQSRRDLAVEGFVELRRAVEQGDLAPLTRLHQRARERARPFIADWRSVWRRGPQAQAASTEALLDALERGTTDPPARGSVRALEPPRGRPSLGCCGLLGKYVPDGVD